MAVIYPSGDRESFGKPINARAQSRKESKGLLASVDSLFASLRLGDLALHLWAELGGKDLVDKAFPILDFRSAIDQKTKSKLSSNSAFGDVSGPVDLLDSAIIREENDREQL